MHHAWIMQKGLGVICMKDVRGSDFVQENTGLSRILLVPAQWY